VRYLYQSGYYSYLIKVGLGLGLGEDAGVELASFNLCLLGCQSLGETLLQNLSSKIHAKLFLQVTNLCYR